jgi:hypothetical protein
MLTRIKHATILIMYVYNSELCTGSHILVVRTPASKSRGPGIESRSRGRRVTVHPPPGRILMPLSHPQLSDTQPDRYTDFITDRTAEESWFDSWRGQQVFHFCPYTSSRGGAYLIKPRNNFIFYLSPMSRPSLGLT